MSGVDPRAATGSIPIVGGPPAPLPVTSSIWRRPYLWTTVGSVTLIFLAALQSLAVTTVMPAVAADLHGDALFAVAFSGTFATSVVGMVIVGVWADRTGPVQPLFTAGALFIAGLVVSASSTQMEVLVAGRLIMGLGSGGQVVALYVVIARIYPPKLQGRVMAAFAAAWIVPSLVGPSLAGALTEYLHWRWVFALVAVVAIGAFALIAVRLRRLDLSSAGERQPGVVVRIGLAVVVAGAAVALSMSGELAVSPLVRWTLAALALAIVLLALLPLLPRGTWRLSTGLPSVVVMRGLIAGALFGAEVYLPKLLIDQYGFSVLWAGVGLTAATLTWAVGSEVSGRFGDRIGNRRIAVIGIILLATGLLACLVAAAWQVAPIVPILLWGASGLGMGLMYPRLTLLTMAYSTPQNQGANASSLQISDSIGAAAVIAMMGLLFTAADSAVAGFCAVFGLGLAIAVVAIVPGLRLGHAREDVTSDAQRR